MYYLIPFTTALAVFTQLGNALPTKRDSPSDADILNYALTLEHLEATFYTEGLNKYSSTAFTDAGYPEFVYPRMTQIRDHENTHVEFLTSALSAAGITPVQACTYKFDHTTPQQFVALAEALESVGASAYTGAAKFLANKDYLTAAASILATEARHEAWLSSSVSKTNPWSIAFETPLDLIQVVTLAMQFIVSCPKSNGPLPVTPNPTLVVSPSAKPGQSAVMEFDAPSSQEQLYCAFMQGFQIEFAPLGADKTCKIPELLGTFYVLVTKGNTKADDSVTVAGPAIVRFPFNSAGNSI